MALRLSQPCSRAGSVGRGPRPRRYHDYIRFATPDGAGRIPLSSSKIVGVANSRGTRSHQEDFYAFSALSLDPHELRLSAKKSHAIDWDPAKLGNDAIARQALFVGIYDGHGGSAVSQFCRQELHGLFENVHKEQIPEMYAWIQEIGGYFKRFRGGALAPWVHGDCKDEMDLEARATLAFFDVDRHLAADKYAKQCGCTASVIVLHTLDQPQPPFFNAKQVSLTVAHVGDTRVLLCATDGGKAQPMTETHHPDARVEAIRLRRTMGSSLITDSFGESRWMGALANTRCLGDLRYKPFGVTPEPEVRTKLLERQEWAYIVLVSDGISSILSDDEIVDLARDAPDPRTAAGRILSFAEELGGEDNMTVIVVPLAGWGHIRGPDRTKELREYRSRQAVGNERQRRM
ncbi:protein serine/threonine phosphatase 2C [Punctularia strigosozonata HHB-11173 SS5]|uniref:protein serine/threonine phosphatase 2C n=1 Tax=Punctularia strigosozonata (strain HHB-11173) TaxID=741275 RepID=UPI0004416947|nr:protein serine/threonine phosphatase 2C [Punctularia strigosozonata HHB-11173 SS5]EIN14106.1 protein serine/threonine phosphatase 2C [Punctularia strigosozonata HHB-11173 SS5]